MFRTAKDFFVQGAHEMVGLNVSGSNYSGWGLEDFYGFNRFRGRGSGISMATSFAGSSLQAVFGPVMATAMGFAEGGLGGAAHYLGAELLQSSFMAHTAKTYGTITWGKGAWWGARLASTTVSKRYAMSIAGSAVGAMLGGPDMMVAGSMLGLPAAQAIGLMALPGAVALGGAYFAAKGAAGVLDASYKFEKKRTTSIEYAGSTAAFMTRQAGTMRGRAVKAINMHQLNARSALGQEATLNHFNNYRKLY